MRWNTHSIRFRLTAWYSAVLLVGLCVFGAGIWLSLRYTLNADLDAALVQQARGLERYLVLEAAEDLHNLPEEMDEFSRSLPADHLVQVQDGNGRPIVSAGSAPEQLVRSVVQVSPAGSFGVGEWNGTRYRTFGEEFHENNRPYRLFLAASKSSIEQILWRLLWLLLTAIPGVVLLAGCGGLWLSRRALAPVDRMTETARAIGFENLSARLQVPQTNDELQRLAETWNAMLVRIENAANRMTRFTADASHELRTPIALIRTTAEVALRRNRPAEDYRDALEQIGEETGRMTQLVEDLLFLARADAGAAPLNLRTFDLLSPIEAAVREIRPLAALKQVRVVLDASAFEASITGDESAIRRLAIVLLDNAVKYSPEGANVTVRLFQAGEGAGLSVHDSGSGISPEALPHIFERFFRADAARHREGRAYGLGLSIAQTIARQHQAEIAVESEAGSTRFRVTFERCGELGLDTAVRPASARHG